MIRPEPSEVYIMDDPHFLRLRRGIAAFMHGYRASKKARAAEAAQRKKWDTFFNASFVNGHITGDR